MFIWVSVSIDLIGMLTFSLSLFTLYIFTDKLSKCKLKY